MVCSQPIYLPSPSQLMRATSDQVSEVTVEAPRDISRIASRAIEGKRRPLLLFEKSAMKFHDGFTMESSSGRERGAKVVWFHGERMADQGQFYSAIREAVPEVASYMGSNLDALDEVLKGAVSRNKSQTTYWLWTGMDLLFRMDPAFFWKVFESVVTSAKVTSEGWFRGPHWGWKGEWIPARQALELVFTGSWEVLGIEATRSDSPLLRLATRYEGIFRDLSTQVQVFRIRATS